ncbi:MAG: oligopeptide/dipeptide ABC transporter ATP-binding protein [Candidatus Firestonebacteria bacterium]
MANLVKVKNLEKSFRSSGGIFGKGKSVFAVNGVNLALETGESLGLVGESGCGKTTVGKLILGLEKPDSGEVYFENKKISGLPEKELFLIRKEMQIVFQDPFASLNPRIRIGAALGEVLAIYGEKDIEKRVKDIIKTIGLPEDTYYRYPHEFSGGQRQRICIARALVGSPRFVVCDEPVSSLDVSVQAQIINLLKDLKESLNLTYLFISHDLRVVRNICDRISVMYYGRIIEEGKNEDIYKSHLHPYTKLLLSSVPSMSEGKTGEVLKTCGENAFDTEKSSGCPFYFKCPERTDKCKTELPELIDKGNGHKVACFNYRRTLS